MSLARYRLQGQPQQKIRPEHLDRAAVVYVRQSSRQQVLEHSESTRLQYALAERAVALGWARSQVVVIDDDLGVSAATADSRKGFARLVTEVTMGRAGVVLGIEMSRLARTGRDWHQLLELCSLSGVLLADPDGVYDPGVYNDRLLLGLKGTMSEAELYLIRQRMLSGKLAKAERGELAVPLPIGYVRRPSGEVVLDPDEQAQHVVRLVFSAFRRLGTLNGVLRYLVGQEVQLPVRVHSGPVEGGAGVAAPDPGDAADHAAQPGLRGLLRLRPPPGRAAPQGAGPAQHGAGGEGQRSEWLVLLPGRLPAYITPEEYEANIARMAANRQTAATPGAPRDGVGAAVRAAALRPVRRAPHDGPLPRRHGGRAVRARLHVRLLPGQLRDRRAAASTSPAPRSTTTSPARSWTRWRPPRWRSPWPPPPRPRTSGPCWTSCGGSGSSAPATPPTGPAASTSSPSRRTGSSPGSWKPTGKPRSPRRPGWRRTTSGSPRNSRQPSPQPSGRRSRPWPRPPAGLARPVDHAGRPQGTAAHPHRGHHRQRRRGQRAGQRHHHLGRRAPDHRAGRPPRRPPGPAVLLPRPPRPRHRTRRRGPQQPADRRRPQRRGIPPAQADQPVHRRAGPHPDHPARHPRPAKGRPAVLTSLAPGQWSVPGLAAELGMPTATIYNWIYRGWITARHAPGTRNWIITADDEQMRQLRERRARPPGYYTRARWAPPEHRTRRATRSTAMRKQRSLTGTSGGRPRLAQLARRWGRRRGPDVVAAVITLGVHFRVITKIIYLGIEATLAHQSVYHCSSGDRARESLARRLVPTAHACEPGRQGP